MPLPDLFYHPRPEIVPQSALRYHFEKAGNPRNLPHALARRASIILSLRPQHSPYLQPARSEWLLFVSRG